MYVSQIELSIGRKLSNKSRIKKVEIQSKESQLAKINKKIGAHEKLRKISTTSAKICGFIIGSLLACLIVANLHGPVMTAAGTFYLFIIMVISGGLYAWAAGYINEIEMARRQKQLQKEEKLLTIEIAELEKEVAELKEKAKYTFDLSIRDRYMAEGIILQH